MFAPQWEGGIIYNTNQGWSTRIFKSLKNEIKSDRCVTILFVRKASLRKKCDHMSIDDYAILPCMVFCKHKTNEEKQHGLGLHTGLEMEKTPSYGWITGIR